MFERLTVLARNPKLLPGVYNYCDRWCEHCPVTRRCLVFAAERLRPPSPGPRSVAGEPGTLLQEIGEDLERVLAAIGPNRKDSPATRAAPMSSEVDASESSPVHPLEFLARHYALQTAGFLLSLPSTPSPSRPPSPMEVIVWFHVLIATKTRRALDSHRHALTGAPALLRDALGSAKVALIGVDRSLAAWQEVAAAKADARIAGLIELLEALRSGLEIRFGEARAFRRPGLD